MTFIEALCNEETRSIIDAIEDIWASMDQGTNSDPLLEDCMDSAVSRLRALGFDFDPRARKD